MANSYEKAIQVAKEGLDQLNVKLGKTHEMILANSKELNTMLSKQGIKNMKELNTLTAKYEKTVKQLESQKAKLLDLSKKQEIQEERLIGLKLTNASKEITLQNKKLAQSKKITESKEKEVVAQKKSTQATIEASRPYVKLKNAQNLAKKSLQDLIVMHGKNSKQVKVAQKRYETLTKKINSANKATSNFTNTSLGGAVKGLRNLIGAFGLIGGVQLFADAISSGFKLATALDSIGFAMKTVITDTKELAQTQTWLKRITEEYGAELVTTTNRYVKFRAASKEAGLTAKETQNIFGTMTKAAGVLGLKTDELTGIYLALEQMISKGKITTEELRRQLGERLPGAMDIMAKSVGVTTAELDDMLKKGEVITKDVLPNFAKQIEIAYGLDSVDKVKTLRAATTRLKNAWTNLVEEFTQGNSVTRSLMNVLDYLASNLSNIVSIGFTVVKFWIAYKTIVKAALIQEKIVATYINLTSKALLYKRYAAIQSAKGIKIATFSMKSFNAVLRANALGIVITALYLAYEAFEYFNKPLGEATRLIKENTQSLQDQVLVYKESKNKLDNLVESYKHLVYKGKLSNAELQEKERLMKLIAKIMPSVAVATNEYGEALLINMNRTKSYNKELKDLLLIKAQNNIVAQTKELENYTEKRKALLEIETFGNSRHIDGFGHVRKVKTEYYVGLSKVVGENKQKLLEYINEVKKGFVASKKNIEDNEDLIGTLTGVLTARQKLAKQIEDDKKAREEGEKGWAEDDERIKGNKNLVETLTKKLEDLKTQRDSLGDGKTILVKDQKQFDDLTKSIEETESELAKYTGNKTKSTKNVIKFVEGSIAYFKKQISLEKAKLENAKLTSEEYQTQEKHIAKLERDLDNYIRKLQGDDFKINLTSKGIDKSIFDGLESVSDSEIIVPFKYTEDAEKIEKLIEKLKTDSLKDIFKGTTDTFSEMFDIDVSKFDFIFESLIDKSDELFSADKIGEWANLSKELIGSVLDASLQRYEIELQQAQVTRDKILDDDLATEEQKEAARKVYEQKERKIKTEQAKQERENTLIKIAMDTAAAVVSIWAQVPKFDFGISAGALTAATISLGAAQAALVASQPLPQFEKGTQNAPDGWAMTDEKGAELHTDKYGNIKDFGSDGGSRYKYLEQGDKIFTASETKNMLNPQDIQRAVFDMNIYSNGDILSEKAVDNSLLNEVRGLSESNKMVWREVKKLASRPIKNNVKVEIKDKKPY